MVQLAKVIGRACFIYLFLVTFLLRVLPLIEPPSLPFAVVHATEFQINLSFISSPLINPTPQIIPCQK